MHPKQICKDVESLGSKLVLDGDDLYIENPENIYSELEEFIKSYKAWIVSYLNGNYTNRHYNVDQTIEKILDFYRGIEQPMNSKINSWLQDDQEALGLILTLCLALSNNGWTLHEPVANYEDFATEELANEVYEMAMAYFKGA